MARPFGKRRQSGGEEVAEGTRVTCVQKKYRLLNQARQKLEWPVDPANARFFGHLQRCAAAAGCANVT
jgi:hypothetical protein